MITKQWENGDSLYIDIVDNQLVITSDPNDGLERQMELSIVTNTETPAEAKLIVKQIGNSIMFVTADNQLFETADGKTLIVPKE